MQSRSEKAGEGEVRKKGKIDVRRKIGRGRERRREVQIEKG